LFSLGNFTFLEWLQQGHQFALGMFHVDIWILDFDLPTKNLDLENNVDITFCATHRQFGL
jgi:hypothetical protein